MKNYLGKCSLKVTRPNGEHSKILVSNPAVTLSSSFTFEQADNCCLQNSCALTKCTKFVMKLQLVVTSARQKLL